MYAYCLLQSHCNDKPCFNFSARCTIKDQILNIGQILDISDPNPVWTKTGHPKILGLVLVGIG